MNELLEVDGLTVSFPGEGRKVEVVRDVSFRIAPGEFVGLVGESGSAETWRRANCARSAEDGSPWSSRNR
jgi:ABC-type glutathione transport system ATPase component